MMLRRRNFWMLFSVCLVLGLAAPAQADLDNAPNAHFLFGGHIFENGQSENIGPAAQIVLEEGMYWFAGDCPSQDGSREDCDLLRFGTSVYPTQCSSQPTVETNRIVEADEDGGEDVQNALKNIQKNSSSPYCDREPDYRPLDEALIAHQSDVFDAPKGAKDSPWKRPNLNLLVLSDIPQTTDRQDIPDYAAHERAKGGIESTCKLFLGGDQSAGDKMPAMPSWVMMAREHTSDAATYGGLLAAAGGTGQCCYDPSYDPSDPNDEPCDPTQESEQIDVCGEVEGLTETELRTGIAEGKFQCAAGASALQTGAMDFGGDTKGTLPHLLCHFAGESAHSNCTGSQSKNSYRRPTDVLAKMSCIRQLPSDYDGGPLEVCDRYGDCELIELCADPTDEDCGAHFVDPNETLVAVAGESDDGEALCEMLADGGHVDYPTCPYEGDPCTVEDRSDGAEATGRCSAGQIACDDDGNEYCEPLYDPMPEICNGLDDDCNGRVDNLSDSWDNFSYDPTELGSYDSDEVDRSGIHCYERDTCRCTNGALDYGGPGFNKHIESWEPGSCQCGEGLSEPASANGASAESAPNTEEAEQTGCSSSGEGSAPGIVAFLVVGLWAWLRRQWSGPAMPPPIP